jgi:hypothetical protein
MRSLYHVCVDLSGAASFSVSLSLEVTAFQGYIYIYQWCGKLGGLRSAGREARIDVHASPQRRTRRPHSPSICKSPAVVNTEVSR